ncbi:MAG: LLM class F420-dependent oxidoreductase [Pseudomonadota bacterium]
MKFGLIPINVGVTAPEQIIGTVQTAEAAGFESVWTFEHVMLPVDNKSRYPYNESGDLGVGADTPFFDPLITLAALAAHTKSIRLGTGVNIVAQTNPLLLAKQVASLDLFCGGRLIFGAGIGWLKQEFEALGVPFERRGARFDDYMVAMKKVWAGDVVEHESDFLSWHGFKSYPLPAQKAALPIVMGGNAGKIFERIAKYGDGWFIPPSTSEMMRTQLAELRKVCESEGRNYDDIEITSVWNPESGKDSLDMLADLGIARAVVMNGGPDTIKAVADKFIQ